MDHLEQQFSLDYSQTEEDCDVSWKRKFFSTIERIQSTLLTNQMSPLHDRYQSFFLLLTNLLHHSTQKPTPLSFKSSSFPLFSFLKVCFACFYRFFYAISGDSGD